MKGKINIEENRKLRENPFSVPEGYFDALAGSVMKRLTAGQDVPDGYFETLPSRIMGRIRMEEAGKENRFHVPGNYFEELPGRILSRIRLEELRNKNTFAVPDGYFETLENRIIEQVRVEEPIVIRMDAWYKRRQVWAVAAGIAVIFTLGVLFLQNQPSGNEAVYLSENSKKEILENPDLYNIDESSILDAMGVSSDAVEADEETDQYIPELDTDLGSVINENE